MKKILMQASMTAVVSGMALAASAVPANAALDQGNNDAACSVGEICFSEYSSNWAQSHKDFWNGANHYANNAHEAYTFNAGTAFTRHTVMDQASGIENRDTACPVHLWDVNGSGTWYEIGTYNGNQGSWTSLGSNGNRNNGHSRCSEGNPVNK